MAAASIFPYRKNRVSPVPTPGGQPAATARKDPKTVDSLSIHANGSIDPFETAFRDKPRTTHKKSKASSPLEKLDPSQLNLVGVMLSDKGNKALLEDASGKGHMIQEGTHIGINAGKVSQILKDRKKTMPEPKSDLSDISSPGSFGPPAETKGWSGKRTAGATLSCRAPESEPTAAAWRKY